MQHTIALELNGNWSDEHFSLDELILRLRELMETKGIAAIAGLVLTLMQEVLILRIMANRSSFPGYGTPCCEAPHLESKGWRERKRGLRSSIGEIPMSLVRYKCTNCGKRFVPLREFLRLRPHQPKTQELEKLSLETASQQSYRRGDRHLGDIGNISVPHSTLHRWVRQSDGDEMARLWEEEDVEVLYADGTGFKRRPDPEHGVTNRGEVRMMFGVTLDGTVMPFGAWSGESWEKIGEEIAGKDEAPIGETLAVDGEPGLAEALQHLTYEQQRCHWHLARDLSYSMWEEDAPLGERKEMSKKLAGLVAIDVPEDDYDAVSDEDLAALEKKVEDAEKGVRDLGETLLQKGYFKAMQYVVNASSRLFAYMRYWLKYGLACPRTINRMERWMREIARRLKRIAFGWSEEGAAQMARIILKVQMVPEQWEQFWSDRFGATKNVIFGINRVHVLDPKPVHQNAG